MYVCRSESRDESLTNSSFQSCGGACGWCQTAVNMAIEGGFAHFVFIADQSDLITSGQSDIANFMKNGYPARSSSQHEDNNSEKTMRYFSRSFLSMLYATSCLNERKKRWRRHRTYK